MPKNHVLFRAGIVIAAGAIAGALFLYFDLWEFFSNRNRLSQYIASFGGWAVVALIGVQIAQVLAAPLPGEITGFVGGFLFGPVMGTVWSTIGLTLGSWAAFSVGRWAGRPLVERFVESRVLSHYDEVIAHGGKKVVFILYLIPGFPKDLLCYVLGMTGLAFRDFLVLSSVGRLFGTAGLSVAGGLVRAERYLEFVVVSTIMGIIVLAAYFNRDKILHPFKWRHERTLQKKQHDASETERGGS